MNCPSPVTGNRRSHYTPPVRRLLLILLLSLPLYAETTITLLHFSDYHSHALPFYSDEGERGGMARAIGYLKQQKKSGALVFSGGDTVNKGAPAWSDKFGCAEWPWLNGIVDAMAFGNHDADYGREAFDRCRAQVKYPILSANTNGFPRYKVLVSRGVRVGVFALAGSDFPQLVKTPGFSFGDPLQAAREVVRTLRERERVDAVVMIGHQDVDDDYAMARSVPGIDLIFGSHSHLKRDLVQIPDTNTVFISPSQYLSYISRVEMTIADKRVRSIRGGLIPVDASLPEDGRIARRLERMRRALERDPTYRELFLPIGRLDSPLSVDALAQRTLETMREVANADVALSTKSSFRLPLPAGILTMELLRGAMPYDNEIVACTMSGAQLQRVLDAAGGESFVSGPASIDPARVYRVATTDFLAHVAHRDVFTCEETQTGLRVRDEVRKRL